MELLKRTTERASGPVLPAIALSGLASASPGGTNQVPSASALGRVVIMGALRARRFSGPVAPDHWAPERASRLRLTPTHQQEGGIDETAS